jgi:nitrate/nitrite-specific signal transduction histidine kinase
MEIEKVMDRQVVADSLKEVLNVGIELLRKDKYEPSDQTKIKLIRTLGSPLAAAVAMVQVETAQQRLALVVERMKQLGYDEPKSIG